VGKIVCTEKLPNGEMAVANIAAKRSMVVFMLSNAFGIAVANVGAFFSYNC